MGYPEIRVSIHGTLSINVPLARRFFDFRSTSNRSSVQRSRREVGEEGAPPLVLVPQPMKLISGVNGYHAHQKRSSSIPGTFDFDPEIRIEPFFWFE